MHPYWRYVGLGMLLALLILPHLPFYEFIKGVAFLVCVGGFVVGGFLWGCKELVGAVLLHTERVPFGDFWGYSALGQCLSGVGLLGGEGLVVWSFADGHIEYVQVLVLLISAGSIISGWAINSRSARRVGM